MGVLSIEDGTEYAPLSGIGGRGTEVAYGTDTPPDTGVGGAVLNMRGGGGIS